MVEEARQRMNALGAAGTPFLFVIDFELQSPLVVERPFEQSTFLFDINGLKNHSPVHQPLNKAIEIEKFPISVMRYQAAFNYCQSQIHFGNSYLLNLTFPTRITTNLTLEEIFYHSRAKYKLLYSDRLVCFSPETFVRIQDGVISSNPMKGTISAHIPSAAERILNNQKEMGEHNTIVDFIRNDLNRVAKRIRVERFRYIDRVETNSGALLQVSSKIVGNLSSDYPKRIGDIMFELLPAGSISGAPKVATLKIIKAAENYQRGYYTGIFGYFDGHNLESAVMIRFIEKQGDQFWFKSGGGITSQSKMEEEYQEMIDKVYIPIPKSDPIQEKPQ